MKTTILRCVSSFLLLLLFLSILGRARSEVITLTSDTFADKVKEKDTVWFVKFCVPWCKHCKKLDTLWEGMAKEVEAEDEVEIGQVNCSTDKPICTKSDIHSYPTFKVFYNGEEFAKYKGPKEVESLTKFILEEAAKATTAEEDDRDLL